MSNFPDSLSEDLKEVYRALIQARSNDLLKNHKGQQMLFYTWHDSQDGCLKFNLISDTKSKLPFGCKVRKVKSLDSIIKDLKKDTYRGLIPWSELTFLDITQEYEEPDTTNYRLNVWSTILPLQQTKVI